MHLIDKDHVGDLDVFHTTTISANVTGTVTVHDGAELKIVGEIVGNVVVKQGGALVLTGRVKGAIVNEGGAVDIFGFVGHVHLDEDADAYVSRGAIIGGERSSRPRKLSPG
jgi:hypothetical protein|tara:strand:- start:114 stop:446 length:333 start_codon:yes stop_codon:yes gene_type:complete